MEREIGGLLVNRQAWGFFGVGEGASLGLEKGLLDIMQPMRRLTMTKGGPCVKRAMPRPEAGRSTKTVDGGDTGGGIAI